MRRRILTVMTVALVMAAMMVAMVAPAFAQRAVDPFVGGAGSREVNISLLALSNPPGGLVFVQHENP
ncbi:MAG: hypothetical protein M3N09_01030 [Actinomycetota bacterium]|nr:hypothetical protein [Actinomycetota bacterium]